MKCEIIIDAMAEEKVIIYAKEKSAVIEAIKKMAEETSSEILGFHGSEIIKLNSLDIECISVINNKIYSCLLKEWLCHLEEKLPDDFVKINQSCLGNIKKMERFDTSISGTLKIRFKNGHTDYVSRRQLKHIKERIGI